MTVHILYTLILNVSVSFGTILNLLFAYTTWSVQTDVIKLQAHCLEQHIST